jgi:hypothetical protein
MMKMASGDGFPLRQGAGTGPRLVLVATEACGGGTPDLGFFLVVSVYIRADGVGIKSRGATRRRQFRGARPRRGGAPPRLVAASWVFWPTSNAPWASSGP